MIFIFSALATHSYSLQLSHAYTHGSNAGAVTYAHSSDDVNAKYIIGGWYNNSKPAVLIKTDRLGNVLQTKEWYYPDDENHFRDIKTVPAGGYVCCIANHIVRIDNDFNQPPLWDFSMSNLPDPNNFYEGYSIYNTDDGGFLVGCYNRRIFKLTSDGNLDVTFNNGYGYIVLDSLQCPLDYILTIFQAKDGDKEFIIVPGRGPQHRYRPFSDDVLTIITIRRDGSQIDYHKYPYFSEGSAGIYGYQTDDNEFLFSGTTGDLLNSNGCIIKTDRSFIIKPSYPKVYTQTHFIHGVRQIQNQNYMLVGISHNKQFNYTFIKTDRLGNILTGWPRFLPGNDDNGSC